MDAGDAAAQRLEGHGGKTEQTSCTRTQRVDDQVTIVVIEQENNADAGVSGVNSAQQFIEPITIVRDSVGEHEYIGGIMFEDA